MLFLTRHESDQWTELGREIIEKRVAPFDIHGKVRDKLTPCFRCFAGALLISKGQGALGKRWFEAGVLEEDQGLMFNAFVKGFLDRQPDRFVMPSMPFDDPHPFMHFASVPVLKQGRETFIRQAGESLPKFTRPLRLIDLGCGNGALIANAIRRWREMGRVGDIGEILLVDPAPAMMDLAVKTVGEVLPGVAVRGVTSTFQKFTETLDGHYDVALSSFAFHHIPYEQKLFHLRKLEPWIDHFVLFELDSNNDLPELHSPELVLSVYQLYGRVIDWVFSHDAPMKLAIATVDNFLMAEAVTMLSLPRGQRTDYHALRHQWHALFRDGLGPRFSCLGDVTTLAEDYLDLFTMHYGRT